MLLLGATRSAAGGSRQHIMLDQKRLLLPSPSFIFKMFKLSGVVLIDIHPSVGSIQPVRWMPT
eukprot:scaffold5595_cov71-Skeletonema_dohrnii-CCMP3373.AAC.4